MGQPIELNDGRGQVKAWIQGGQVETAAKAQLMNLASMPFIHKWVAAMPDCHLGKGATIGSVLPTKGAIIPAAVGVDLQLHCLVPGQQLHTAVLVLPVLGSLQ